MKKSKIKTIIILVLVVLLAVVLFYVGQNKKINDQVNLINQDNQKGEVEKTPEILGNKADLISCSVKPGSTISGNLVFNGIVKNGYFFEGNIVINILDQNKDILKKSYGNAVTDWMTSGPVSFTGSIDLTGVPAGAAYFEIHNDNASGIPENDKSILIPVIIENSVMGLNYIYKNHGVTFELPKSFVMPAESRLENSSGVDMDVYVITLPNGYLSYTTSAPWWEKNNISQYKYVKDEKIGETTFKVYTNKNDNGLIVYYYWFKRGNVGYEFRFNSELDKNILNTFRFVGWAS